ncbi:hypothetical protein HHI36_003451 [Cryptolaemus montrouzieri]|uniref:Solute carrier family 46 member 3 n=1 Tax=Cryptolaemus montrouzieri TaxID=559131 RepID=A0ABD2PDF9_9CUCU
MQKRSTTMSSSRSRANSPDYMSTRIEDTSTTCGKLKNLLNQFTLEPVVFFYMVAFMMNAMANTNLGLEKACRVNIGFNSSICDAMVTRDKSGYNSEQEAAVQKLVTKFIGYRTILTGSIPVITMIFVGAWSDQFRCRKPVILIPIFGDLISTIGQLFCSHYLLEWPLEYVWFFDTIPYTIFGGQGCAFMGVFSYVAGLCKDKDRTLKIGTVSMCYPIGMSLGLFLTGLMLNCVGYRGVYTFSACNLIIAIIYGVMMIKEKSYERTEEEKKKSIFRELFNLNHAKTTFKTCFMNGERDRRFKIFIIMLLCVLILGPLQAEVMILYMYIRFKCGWNEMDFGVFNSVHFGVQMVGNCFALSFFTKYLKIDDALLGVIAMISKISACFIYAFAPTGIYFYVGGFVEVFHSSSFIALRALMAKIVPPHELGQTNSVFGICEALTPLLFGPLYTTIYVNTISFFPGTFYLLTIVFYFITVYLFILLYTRKRKSKVPLDNDELEKLDTETIKPTPIHVRNVNEA